jgi:hypothetical protein
MNGFQALAEYNRQHAGACLHLPKLQIAHPDVFNPRTAEKAKFNAPAAASSHIL